MEGLVAALPEIGLGTGRIVLGLGQPLVARHQIGLPLGITMVQLGKLNGLVDE